MVKRSFQEKELEILRAAVDKIGNVQGKKLLKSPEVTKIVDMVEQFLRRKKEFVMVEQQLIIYYQLTINFIIKM